MGHAGRSPDRYVTSNRSIRFRLRIGWVRLPVLTRDLVGIVMVDSASFEKRLTMLLDGNVQRPDPETDLQKDSAQ